MAAVLAANGWSFLAMTDHLKDTLLGAFRHLMRPLVRILLRNGVSYTEYAETAKTVFVEVAGRDTELVEGTGPVTTSKIAILTGLTRSEVERISDSLNHTRTPSTATLDRVGRILAGWHQDPELTGPYGLPLELPLKGREPNFDSLISRYSPESSSEVALNELLRIRVAIVVASSRVRVLKRSYIPEESDPAIVQFMGIALRDLAETLDYNLNPKSEGGFFERRVWTPIGISPSDMPAFDGLVHAKGQQFLESLDNYLASKEAEAESLPASEKVRVGVGVYLFSDANRMFPND